ncbi:MAG: hypothetical protein AAGI25_13975 [Bacteroidota bacterium]
MSQSTVHSILKSQDLKPHKVDDWCGKSTDPEFEEKMLHDIDLYLNPPENALVLSVDEKTKYKRWIVASLNCPYRQENPKD